MNRDELKGKWKQIKGDAKVQWGKLTDDELDQVNGNSEKLAGKIQEAYGITRKEAEKQINDWKCSS